MKNNKRIESQNLEVDEDFELIKKFQNGNEASFSKLVIKHREKVRNLVYLTLGDVDYIDDISQDVFISAFHKLKDFRFESKFTTWIYRVTVNKCRDYLRKKKVRTIFVPLNDAINSSSSNIRQENFDLLRLLKEAINKLPEKLKVPLVLRDIDGFSYKEIAVKLNCEVGTVKSRIFRARESLRFILEPYQKELKG